MIRAAAFAVVLILTAAALNASPKEGRHGPLGLVEQKAKEAVEEYRALRRLLQDLRYIAEEVDRERLGERESLTTHSQNCLTRLDYLKKNGKLDPRLYDPNETSPDPDRVMTRLERICRELPNKTYAAEYPRSLIKAIATELREAAEGGRSEAEILAVLKDHLVLPDLPPGEEDAFQSLALFPIDVPEARFRKLGAIRIFLVKHRIKRPKSHVRTDWKRIADGKHNAQIGVEIEGRVLRHGVKIDGDYTFDIGDLHIEMTPEWRLLHPKTPKPRKGDRIRVRGWTYVDVFHKAEMEYDPKDPVLGVNRVTQWEIHPLMSATFQLLRCAGGSHAPEYNEF